MPPDNDLVGQRNRTQEAWSQIGVELKRRHDLIPNLVEAAKGYAAHERATLETVTATRAGAVSARATCDPARIGPAKDRLTQSLRGYARRCHNTSARDYDISPQTFPRNLIAGAFGFPAVTYFEAGEADQAVPRVSSRIPGRRTPYPRRQPTEEASHV